MLERDYQAQLIKKIEHLMPGCIVLKNDSGYKPGFPDLLVLYGLKWAVVEVKLSAKSSEQPNQRYYVDKTNEMSFGAFIHPENEREVLNALCRALQPSRRAFVSKR